MDNYNEFTNEEMESYEGMSPSQKYEVEKILNDMEMDMKMWRKLRNLTCTEFEMLKKMSDDDMKEYLQSRIPRRKTASHRVTRKSTKSQYAKSRKTTKKVSSPKRKTTSPKRKTTRK